MRKIIALAALFSAVALPAHASLKIFACEPEWAALSTEIGGKLVSVYAATAGGQDPHQIQARPSLIAKARAADLAVCTGAELEVGWMPQVARQAANPKIQPGADGYFETTSVIALRDAPTSLDRSQGDLHAAGNPHIQTDPRNMLIVAKALAAKFSELDSANAAAYQSGYADFEARWKAALAKWQTEAAPLKGTPIAVQHKSWVYMIDWIGLKEVIALEPIPGVPPSSGYLAQVLETLQKQPVKMIVRAAYEDPRSSEFVSERAGVPAVMLPFTIGGTDDATDLFSLYDDTINLMLKALQK
jgi:zinc/manganese transport system substrate-binding protein